jgi:hypothetical protein
MPQKHWGESAPAMLDLSAEDTVNLADSPAPGSILASENMNEAIVSWYLCLLKRRKGTAHVFIQASASASRWCLVSEASLTRPQNEKPRKYMSFEAGVIRGADIGGTTYAEEEVYD